MPVSRPLTVPRWLPCAAFTVIVALAAVPAAGATQGAPPTARVNGKPVPRLAVQMQMNRLLPMASYHGRIDQEAWERVVDQAVEAATEQVVISEKARKDGLEVEGKELDRIESAWIEKAGSKEAFETWLEKQGTSPDEFREVLRRQQLAETLESRIDVEIESRPAPSDADIERYYEENREKFVRPASMDVQHILIRVQPWEPQAEWARVEKRADWIAKRARSGEDFGHLAELYSDDPETKDRGGRMNGVHQQTLTGPLEQLAAGLKPGEIGGPVRSLYGFHILKLLARHPPRQLAFGDLDREQLRSDLRRKRIADAKDEWRQGLLKNARIELDQSEIELLRRRGGGAAHGVHGGSRTAE